MRTRIHKWLNMKSRVGQRSASIIGVLMFGIQVYHGGKWAHAHRNGQPILFKALERAERERAKIRKLKASPVDNG